MIDFDKPRSITAQGIAARIKAERDAGEGDGRAPAGQRIDDVTAALIVSLVGLAAVPAASVAPVFWMIWTLLFGLLLAGHALALLLADRHRTISATGLWPVLLPGFGLPLVGLAQAGVALLGGETSFAGHAVPLGSLAPEASLVAAIRLFGYGALFLLSYEVATRASRVTAMAWGLFSAVVLEAAWALIALKFLGDMAFWGEKAAYLGAATGSFVNRNSLATFLGMGLVTGIALTMARAQRPHMRAPNGRSLFSERNLETLALSFLLTTVAAALVATQSRMGVTASFLASVFVYAVMSAKQTGALVGALVRAAAVLLVGFILASGVFGQDLLERGLFTIGNAGTRADFYTQVIGMIRARPIVGTGLDSFPVAFQLVHAPPVSSGVTWDLAHSSYLMLWSEMGLVLGSLPMLALLIAAIRLIKTIRRRRSDYAVSVAALGVIVLGAIHSTLDFSLEIPANTMLFLTLIALGLGPLRRKAQGG